VWEPEPPVSDPAEEMAAPVPASGSVFTLDTGVVCNHLHHIRDFLLSDRRVFLDREAGELVSVYEDHAEPPATGSREKLRLLRDIPEPADRFVEISIPDYSQWHTWFEEFVLSIGRWHDRLNDIGGWVKSIATEEERAAWAQFSRARIAEHAVRSAAEAGLTIRIADGPPGQ
jgi:hypothetical protein